MSFISRSIAPLLGVLGLASLCATAQADTTKFTLHKAMDPGDASHVAISYLIPVGWKANDTIDWDIHRRMSPLVISTVVNSPDNRYIVRWTNTSATNYVHQGGPVDHGAPPPQHPTDLMIQTFKNGHPGIDPEVVERQETPTSSIFPEKPLIQSSASDCSVRLRYTVDGMSMITKVAFHFDEYHSTRFGTGLWTLHNITSVTGPEAQFDRAMKLGSVALSSRKWDPQFFEQYQEITLQLLAQIQKEGQARLDAQFAAMRRQYHDLSVSNKEAFEAQMAAKDKSTRQFCDYILDRRRVTDGHTEMIVPSGTKHVLTDGTHIVLTDDDNFDPHGGLKELHNVP